MTKLYFETAVEEEAVACYEVRFGNLLRNIFLRKTPNISQGLGHKFESVTFQIFAKNKAKSN
jgi:hypothetical protein